MIMKQPTVKSEQDAIADSYKQQSVPQTWTTVPWPWPMCLEPWQHEFTRIDFCEATAQTTACMETFLYCSSVLQPRDKIQIQWRWALSRNVGKWVLYCIFQNGWYWLWVLFIGSWTRPYFIPPQNKNLPVDTSGLSYIIFLQELV